MKRIIFIFLVFFIGLIGVHAHTFDNTLKIYDYGQVLNDNEEVQLKQLVDEYIYSNKADMVLVTVKHYNQNSIDEYIDTFYRQNEFKLDGIIIAIDLKNDNASIRRYGKLIGLYTEDEIKEMINDINSTEKPYNKFIKFINLSKTNIYYNLNIESDKNIKIKYIIFFAIAIIIASIYVLIQLIKIKKIDYDNYYSYCDKIDIAISEDKYLTTETKHENRKRKV